MDSETDPPTQTEGGVNQFSLKKTNSGYEMTAPEWAVVAPTLPELERESMRYAFLYGNEGEVSVALSVAKSGWKLTHPERT